MTDQKRNPEEIRKEMAALRWRLSLLESELAGCGAPDPPPGRDLHFPCEDGDRIFASIFRSTSVLLAVTRLSDGVILEVNHAFEKYYGMPREEIIGRTTEDLGIWTSSGHRAELLEMLVREGRFEEHEMRVYTPLKGTRDILWSADVMDVGGEPHVISATLDITSHKRIERELTESRERLEMALAGGDLGTWETSYQNGGETILIKYDQRAAEMIGRGIDELGSDVKWLWEQIHPEDREGIFKAWGKHEKGYADRFQAELRVRTKAGDYRWLLAKGRIVARDQADRPLQALGTLVDMHERRTAEERLKASEADLNKAQELAGMGSYQWDVATGQLFWSRNMYAIAGIDPQDFKGDLNQAMETLLPPGEYLRTKERVRSMLEAKEFIPSQFCIVRPDGEERVIRSDGTLLLDPQGRPERIIGVNLDVTERYRAQQERERMEARMLQSQKLESLGLLAGGVAHDFNNMLMGVMGNADMALDELPGESSIREHLERIKSTAKRLGDLTSQLLAYAGKGRFLTKPVDLSSLVKEQLALLRTVISKNAELDLKLDEKLPSVEGEESQLRQVVMNLIINASDALLETRGQIRVRTGLIELDRAFLDSAILGERLDSGCYAFVEVRDTGRGMDQKTLDRIFDPFFTTKSHGRGLGLAAALGIVGGHNGAMTVDSRSNEGTRFRVFLPCSKQAALRESVRETTAPHTDHLVTALVVDDEDVVREVLEKQLSRAGYRVLTAKDGQEGVDIYQQRGQDIDLVVLDKTMPRLDGLEALNRILGQDPQARVILMSGFTQQSLTLPDHTPGQLAFLQKPFSSNQLFEKIRQLMG